MNLVAVGIGGIVGAMLRFIIGKWIPSVHLFPLGTLMINWMGCLFLGWFFTFTEERMSIPPRIRLGIGTGMTGAFTTFSTFSLEIVQLLQGHAVLALAYILASIAGGLLLVWIGYRFAKG